MSNPLKKQKLNVDDNDIPLRIQNENVTSPVTAIVSFTDDTTIFSGHRDGTICRWNLDACKDRHVPDWIISACLNLTDHEVYGTEEKLGIAGLAIRPNHCDSSKSSTNSVESNQMSFILYSWNHQREDMRESNGIPQKVMLWNGVTGERRSALMIDVGRSDTGVFANPLVSCLVFCKLLVDQPPKKLPPAKNEDGGKSTGSTSGLEKVWTDVIVVALQATCEAPINDVDLEPQPKMDSSNPQKIMKPTVVSGNILPFIEHTRQRLKPWSSVGGFVRALAVPDNAFILSVTETTRSTISETQNDSTRVDTDNEGNDETKKILDSNDYSDGQAYSITLWDTSCPGAVLYTVKVCDIHYNDTPLDGTVYALTMSNTKLLLAMAKSKETGCAVVIDLPQRPIKEMHDEKLTVSICGVFALSPGIAASHVGNWIALSQKVKCTEDSKKEDVHIFTFMDLCTSLDDNTSNTDFDILKLQNVIKWTAPHSSQNALTKLFIGESHVVTGYGNGAIFSMRIPTLTKDTSVSGMGSNEYVSCSTASIGLRGALCPHLLSSANNLNLQNKCLIM
jgi:hypothetical protein